MKPAKFAWKFFVVVGKIFAWLLLVLFLVGVYLAYEYNRDRRIPNPDWLHYDVRFPVPTGFEIVDDDWIVRSDPALAWDRAMMSGADPGLKNLTLSLESLVGVRPSIHTMYCARNRVGNEWILENPSLKGISQPQLQQLSKAYSWCAIARERIAEGTPMNRYNTRSIRHEINEHVKAKAGLTPMSPETVDCIRTHRDQDEFMACMARHDPDMPLEVLRIDWGDVLKLVENLRKDIPATSSDVAGSPG